MKKKVLFFACVSFLSFTVLAQEQPEPIHGFGYNIKTCQVVSTGEIRKVFVPSFYKDGDTIYTHFWYQDKDSENWGTFSFQHQDLEKDTETSVISMNQSGEIIERRVWVRKTLILENTEMPIGFNSFKKEQPCPELNLKIRFLLKELATETEYDLTISNQDIFFCNVIHGLRVGEEVFLFKFSTLNLGSFYLIFKT